MSPRLPELFDAHRTLRAVIDCALEGRLGRIETTGPAPRAARLDLGCYAIFGGAPSHEAEDLVRAVEAPRELLVPDDQAWRDLLHAVHGRRLEDRTMRTFSAHALEPEVLRGLAAQAPPGFRIGELDVAAAGGLDASLAPHALQTFATPADFVAQGIGCAAFDGDTVACVASSYAVSSKRIEVAIATRAEYRGRGLARATAACMLLRCLDRGLVPEWSAANPVSKRLALSLGYRPGALCDIFFLPVAPHSR